MNNSIIHLIILFAFCLAAIQSQLDLPQLRSRITIFDLVFNNWMTASIASVGVVVDYFMGNIPYPSERNSTRLFDYIDDNYDQKLDLKEFQSYLVKLFHAQDVVSFEFGRKVSASEIADHFSLWGPTAQNMRWKCFLENFDENSDSAIDFEEFQTIKKKRFDALNCLICIKYHNHCIDFKEIYLTKL